MLDFKADISASDQRTATADRSRHIPTAREFMTTPPLLQAVLDGLPQALAVLDASGRLVFWNAAARARLGAAGWSIVDQRLRAASLADREALARALPKACARGCMQLLRLGPEGRPTHAALTPIRLQGQCWAVLQLDREALCGAIEMQLFASSSGLSPAESRVLARLANGLRPAQIAREHGVATSTVLSQVSALRSKTQSASVMSLLACLARLPALRPLYIESSL